MIAAGWTFLGYVWIFPIFLKALVLFPALIGIIGYLEYKNNFCVYYGLREKENVADTTQPKLIQDKSFIEADKQRSLYLILLSMVGSFVYTILVILLF
jgi:hypothetical protein